MPNRSKMLLTTWLLFLTLRIVTSSDDSAGSTSGDDVIDRSITYGEGSHTTPMTYRILDAKPTSSSGAKAPAPNTGSASRLKYGEDEVVDVYKFLLDRDLPLPPLQYHHLLGMQFKLYHIVDVDDVQQFVHMKARLKYRWRDPRLSWSHLNNSVESAVIFATDKIWTPEVKLQQSLEIPTEFSRRSYKVRHDGRIEERNYYILRVTCPMSVLDYPFDTQSCELTFSCTACFFKRAAERLPNITFWNDRDIAAFVDSSYADIGGQKSNEFEVKTLKMRLEDFKPVLTLVMRRRSSHLIFYLVAPTLIIAVVALLQFALPPDGGEKVTVGVTCLLSMTVFMIVLQQNVAPDTEGDVPLLGSFFGLLMLTITGTTTASALVIKVHFKGKQREPSWPPLWVLRICRVISHVLFLQKKAVRFAIYSAARVIRNRKRRSWSAAKKRGFSCDAAASVATRRKSLDGACMLMETNYSFRGRALSASSRDSVHVRNHVDAPGNMINMATCEATYVADSSNAESESMQQAWEDVADIINTVFFVVALMIVLMSNMFLFIVPLIRSTSR